MWHKILFFLRPLSLNGATLLSMAFLIVCLVCVALILRKKILSLKQRIYALKKDHEATLEMVSEGVICLDQALRVEALNFAAIRILGAPKKEIVSQPLSALSCKDRPLQKRCHELVIASHRHKSVVTDSFCSDPVKKIYYDIIVAQKPYCGGFVLFIQDKSSHHKVFEMGKDFVANASHELRTPITIIKGFAETLQDMKQMPAEMLDGIIEKIVRNCERMESLVKNLLTLADLENLSVSEYHVSDLVTLVENCKQMTTSVYSDIDITIQSDHDTILANADGNILELALINLLSNAAKYSSGPAKICVSLQVQNEDASITIQDQGIGIAQEDLSHIFERFYTVNKAHTRKLGGAGLGLSLVKLIIDKHHGTIDVSSELGRGTSFTLTLPLSRSFKVSEAVCSVP